MTAKLLNDLAEKHATQLYLQTPHSKCAVIEAHMLAFGRELLREIENIVEAESLPREEELRQMKDAGETFTRDTAIFAVRIVRTRIANRLHEIAEAA
jgi:hypothetical protein